MLFRSRHVGRSKTPPFASENAIIRPKLAQLSTSVLKISNSWLGPTTFLEEEGE